MTKGTKSSRPGQETTSFGSKMASSKWILVLFAASLVTYWFLHVPMTEQTFRGMIIKCLPIVILQLLVFQHGLSSSDSYGHKILAAIFLSSIGDAFLDFPGYFIHGAGFFLVAHLFYISAFGFTPLKLGTGIGIFGVLSLPLILIYDALSKLEPIPSVVLPIYALILKTMVWRSVVQATNQPAKALDWGKVAGGIGGLLFALSDATLGINKFYQPVPEAQKVIMATYYLAQFFLALSIFQKRPSAKQS